MSEALALETTPLAFTDEVAARTAPVWERVKSVVPAFDWPGFAPEIDAIQRLKRERDAVVLAHNYQTAEIFHGVADIVGVADHLFAAEPAQKLVEGDVQSLGFDIPESKIDGTEDGGPFPAKRKETAAVKLLPEEFGPEGVFADQLLGELTSQGIGRAFAPGNPPFPDPTVSLIGLDEEEKEVPDMANDVGGNTSNPHSERVLSVSQRVEFSTILQDLSWRPRGKVSMPVR